MNTEFAGDYAEDANRLARKAWRALARGTGMHLSADEVIALHKIERDGDWWQAFNPTAQADSQPIVAHATAQPSHRLFTKPLDPQKSAV